MMPLTGAQLTANVDSQIRRRAAGDRAPSPPPSPPPPPPQQHSLSSVVVYPGEPIIGQRTGVELSQQIRDEIRGNRAMDVFERRSSSLLGQQSAVIPFRPDPETASQPSPTSNPDSVGSDDIRPGKYTGLYGFVIFAFAGLFFCGIGIFFREGVSRYGPAFKYICNVAASCMGAGAAKLLYDWKFSGPRKPPTECRLVLKEMKRAVIQTEKRRRDFVEGLDTILDIDRYVQWMAREGGLEAYGKEWRRWGKLRERYQVVQRIIPPVDLNIPSSQQGPEETGNGLDMVVYEA